MDFSGFSDSFITFRPLKIKIQQSEKEESIGGTSPNSERLQVDVVLFYGGTNRIRL